MLQFKQQQGQQIMTNDAQPLNEDISPYKQSKYRYINLIIYIVAAMANSLPAQTFSSINSLVSEQFDYNSVMVTLFTLIFPILHPVCAFPANWILDKFGMKIGCMIGSLMVIAGVWMRTLIEYQQPIFGLIGSVLAAVGNVFILNSPSILANNWFKPSSIPGIISLAVLANIVSVTLGSALPGLVLSYDNDAQKPTTNQIKNFLRIQAIAISICLGIMIVGFKTKPELPPSRSAENKQKMQQDYSKTLKKLFKSKQYLKIMLVMTFSYGTTISYLANLDPILNKLGFLDSGFATASVVLSAMASGIVASFFFIRKIKATLQYKAMIVMCTLVGFISFLLLQGILLRVPSQGWVLLIIGACCGISMIPITSILMAYSSQVIYPLGEGSATGYLFAASQTFGFIIGIGSAALIKQGDIGSKWPAYTLMGAHSLFLLTSFLCSLATTNMLNRTRFERKFQSGYLKAEQVQTAEGLIFSST